MAPQPREAEASPEDQDAVEAADDLGMDEDQDGGTAGNMTRAPNSRRNLKRRRIAPRSSEEVDEAQATLKMVATFATNCNLVSDGALPSLRVSVYLATMLKTVQRHHIWSRCLTTSHVTRCVDRALAGFCPCACLQVGTYPRGDPTQTNGGLKGKARKAKPDIGYAEAYAAAIKRIPPHDGDEGTRQDSERTCLLNNVLGNMSLWRNGVDDVTIVAVSLQQAGEFEFKGYQRVAHMVPPSACGGHGQEGKDCTSSAHAPNHNAQHATQPSQPGNSDEAPYGDVKIPSILPKVYPARNAGVGRMEVLRLAVEEGVFDYHDGNGAQEFSPMHTWDGEGRKKAWHWDIDKQSVNNNFAKWCMGYVALFSDLEEGDRAQLEEADTTKFLAMARTITTAYIEKNRLGPISRNQSGPLIACKHLVAQKAS
jgi:hypothetical protein